ncbi:class I adenylate-forming enzyme family protein [Pilimelia terevasa]|uniref:class I adenylate-forming enzyme family protein n=1 Tax=Pilimelia terevasa TaxID=53372 RepID=UPI00166E96BD|nr:class I adenylate-forming enzyme family protein [Pilimelia terevasa]
MPDHRDLAEYVRTAAAHSPGRPAFRTASRLLTWGALDARVEALASEFAALRPAAPAAGGGGCPPRLVLALADGLDFAAAYFGCLRAGLVAVPVDPRAPAGWRAHVLADSGAAAVLDADGIRHTSPVPGSSPGGAEAPALLLYPPSGSAVMLPHRALLAHHAQLSQVEPPLVRGDDTVLVAAPLHQVYGLNCGVGAVAYHGACGVLADHTDPAGVRELVAAHHVTTVLGVPSLYAGWAGLPGVDADLETVRVAACGPVPPEPGVAARFTARTGQPIFSGYGLAEAGPVVTTTLVDAGRRAAAADGGVRIGSPLPGVRVGLRAPDGRLVPVAPHADAAPARGELAVSGPNLFTGYWPDSRGGPDRDGWWATGDRAYADVNGVLYLEGRGGPGPRAAEGE